MVSYLRDAYNRDQRWPLKQAEKSNLYSEKKMNNTLSGSIFALDILWQHIESFAMKYLWLMYSWPEESFLHLHVHKWQHRPVGAMAKWLKLQTADAEVPSSSSNHGMEELGRSFFNHCFTPPRCNGYLELGNLSDGAGMSS